MPAIREQAATSTPFPKTWDTLPKYDLSYFENLSIVVNEEPVQEKDLVMMGMLPSLGIRKGQPFKPDAETAKTLEQAVKPGYQMMQNYFTTPGKALVTFWPDRQWQTLNLSRQQAGEGFPFVTADELLLDPRGGGVYFWATWLPKHLGKGSFYLMGLRDKIRRGVVRRIFTLSSAGSQGCAGSRILVSHRLQHGNERLHRQCESGRDFVL